MTERFSEQDMRAFEADAKIGLLATVDAEHRPHLTLITSLQAKGPTRLMFGQFCEGLSKKQVKADPHAGFLVMDARKRLWRGRALWSGTVHEGQDYELYNKKPMFRYNAYFGIATVHYLDLVAFTGPQSFPLPGLMAGSLLALLSRPLAKAGSRACALKPWAEGLLGSLKAIKFLSYVDSDGYPRIVPAIPCRTAGRGRLLLGATVHRRELQAIAAGSRVAVFALNDKLQSVLVRGCFCGYRGYIGVKAAAVDIEWVYNSMPPKQGQVYPHCSPTPVTTF